MSKTLLLGTRVSEAQYSAASKFAAWDRMTLSDYLRAAVLRKANAVLKVRMDRIVEIRQSIASMLDALESGNWKKLSVENPELYPATAQGWKEEIETREAVVAELLVEAEAMNEEVKILDRGLVE